MSSANPYSQQRTFKDFAEAMSAIAGAVKGRDDDPYGADFASQQSPAFSLVNTQASRPNETPQNMLQQQQAMDFNVLDQLRARSSQDAAQLNNTANSNQEAALRRILTEAREKEQQSNQSKALEARMQSQMNAEQLNNYSRQLEIEKRNQPITSTTKTSSYAMSDEALRNKQARDNQKMVQAREANNNLILMRNQGAIATQQQKAQQQAQERLARIGQQTDIYRSAFGTLNGGGTGESSWRWF